MISPPGVVFTNVDVRTGQIATPQCPRDQVISEAFVKGTQPSAHCAEHGGGGSELPGTTTTLTKRGDRQSGFWNSLFGR